MKKFFGVIILIMCASGLFAQNDSSAIKKNIFYQDEIMFGLRIKTNGWGLNYRRAYYRNIHLKNLFEIGINTIKSPKETKIKSLYNTGRSFVYGKMNECYDIRTGFGQQYTLFDKKTPGTVAIRMFWTTGADLGLLKPIYYVIMINQTTMETVTEKYKPSHQPAVIERKAPFTQGLSELQFNPGWYVKVGTSFEYSKSATFLNSVEMGLEFSAYLKKMEIMAEIDNPRMIFAMFISYRIGKLVENKQKPANTSLDF